MRGKRIMKSRTQNLTFLGIMTAVCMVLSFVEAMLPAVSAVAPGIKMGLPNIFIIALLYSRGIKQAAAVSFVRIVLSALLFGNLMTFVYSLSGAALSLTVMLLLKKSRLFSTVGVSVSGGISHNLGQILAAVILLGTKEIAYYMIVLCVTGTLAGIFVGVAATFVLKYIK